MDDNTCYLQLYIIQNVHLQSVPAKKWSGQNPISPTAMVQNKFMTPPHTPNITTYLYVHIVIYL